MTARTPFLLVAFGVLSALLFTLAACSSNRADLQELATAAANVEPQTEITITARNLEFDTDTIVVPALSEIHLTLVNDDAGALHNIAIYRNEAATQDVFRGQLGTGVETREYNFAAPPEGIYYFRCDAHPEMDGAFIVRAE